MSLKDTLTDDMKNAMRAKDTERLGTIRLVLAAIKQKEVDERVVLDDAQVLAIIDKQVKQRNDSINQFRQAGRVDLVDKEEAELAVLVTYLPKQLSADEVAQEVAKAVVDSGAKSAADMGKVMGLLKPRLAGKTDLSKVSGLVKDALSKLA
jgi:uncharacterized protein